MRKRNVVLLIICSLITTAVGSAITYYEHEAVTLQAVVVEMAQK